MKKCFFVLLSFFFLTPIVFAETLLEKEVSNGKIELQIKTDQGYMDAFDAQLKVSSDVSIQGFTWDTFLNSMAVKNYSISSDKKTIQFVVSSKASNILLANKTISLGVLEVSSSHDSDYSLELSQFSFTNLEKDVVVSNGLFQTNQTYHYEAKKEENNPSTPINPSEPANPEPSTPSESETPMNPIENPSSGSNESETVENESSSQESNSSSEEKPKEDKEEIQEEKTNDKNEIENKEPENDKEVETDKGKDKDTNSFLLFFTLGFLAVIVIIFVIYILSKRKVKS